MIGSDPPDWQVAPNIAGDPETYELENEALLRDGRLDRAESLPVEDDTIERAARPETRSPQ